MRKRLPAILFLLAGGCSFELPLSALDPAGPGASSVAGLWWVMFWASMAITGAMILLALAVVRWPRGRTSRGAARGWIVGGGLVFPGAVLIALMLYGFGPGRVAVHQSSDDEVFRIEVVAHQWWWEVIYPDQRERPLYDANEIHVPVGRPVHVHVSSADVVHSFWVPRLGGKIDAIPGHTNRVVLQADAAGIYRGQCSEFCGAQHARMGFHLEAHEEEALQRRLTRLQSGSARADEIRSGAGAGEFDRHCAECHSLDPSLRSRLPGPNLAGLRDRHSLGGGWLENDPEARRRWLSEHQAMKPGNRMPELGHLDDVVLDRIAAFLEQGR